MERHPKTASRRSGRHVEPRSASTHDPVPLPLPHIEELIAFGEITVSNEYPVVGVAVASDEHSALVMLVRCDGEALAQLLTRLDPIVAKAIDESIYIGEINPSF